MSKRHFLVSTLTTIAVCGALFRFTDLSVAQNPPATTTAAPQPFNPSFGDLMNLLVQPRHIKLAFAGREANWPLAAYEIKELRAALATVARTRPRFRDQPVAEMTDSVMSVPFRAIDDAIRDQSATKFAEAFVAVTQACNGCHAALNHAFVVIRVPDQASFPNQDFRPQK